MAVLYMPRSMLRPVRATDVEPLAAMNSDPEVMKWFPATLTREQSDDMARRVREAIERQGWGTLGSRS